MAAGEGNSAFETFAYDGDLGEVFAFNDLYNDGQLDKQLDNQSKQTIDQANPQIPYQDNLQQLPSDEVHQPQLEQRHNDI